MIEAVLKALFMLFLVNLNLQWIHNSNDAQL